MSFTLLCLLRDARWRNLVEDAAAGSFRPRFFESGASLLSAETGRGPCAILADNSLLEHGAPDDAGIRASPECAAMGVVLHPEDHRHFDRVSMWGADLLLSSDHPPAASELRRSLVGFFNREPFGVQSHIPEETSVEWARIRSLDDKSMFVERLERDIAEKTCFPRSPLDIRLVFEELVNNALVHAFVSAGGVSRYEIGSMRALDEGHVVTAGCAIGARWIGVTVRDNQGRLNRQTVLDTLSRQYTLAGLTDESGRGLYLCRLLSTKMIFSIQPGRQSEAAAFFDCAERSTSRELAIYRQDSKPR